MKKVLLLMMAAFFAVTAASAQEIGGWAVGPRMGIYTNTDTVIGVGAMARYRFDNHWRIEPSAVALLHKHCSVDISEIEIDGVLTEHFKEHDYITTKELEQLCGLSNATALRRLKNRVNEGKLTHPGHLRAPFYFPVPGNYGVSRG